MDQDSFRRLLQTPKPAQPAGSTPPFGSHRSLAAKSGSQAKLIGASEPAFKPRKVKKSTAAQYRDRAAERRTGEGNDFAEAEALLEDFEKRNADTTDKATVEQQRRYLGGDGEHSILVKGLDFALLEQNKARAAAQSTEDDESLEQAFRQAAIPEPADTVPKKRTREDILRELKEKRGQNGDAGGNGAGQPPKTTDEEARGLEDAKKKGKFMPIGFKPIGSSEDTTKKKKKANGNATDGAKVPGRKKKRRKIASEDVEGKDASTAPTPVTPSTSASAAVQAKREPEPLPADFDIFEGAGEYQGVDLGDDESESGEEKEDKVRPNRAAEDEGADSSSFAPRRWVPTDEREEPPEAQKQAASARSASAEETKRSASPSKREERTEEDMEEDQPMRLQPLASSAVPSIKDLLALNDAAEAEEKRRKRKEKRKASQGGPNAADAKINRDYQRLKSYTEKTAGASNS